MVSELSTESVPIPWRNAAITVDFRRGEISTEATPSPIVIFANGLGVPKSAWAGTLERLPRQYTLLTYDRFGQGETPPLPDDVPEELRDGAAAARDLDELIKELLVKKEGVDLTAANVFVVAHSIGVAIVRLLINNHDTPGIKGVLFLDPSIVNSDFVSIYPPPSDDEPEELTRTRDATRRIFHPDVPNKERLNRKTFAKLLPLAEEPALRGDPYLTVVAHDPNVAFGEASEKLGVSTKYARQYIEPYWQDYNQKLLLSVPSGKGKGPVVAAGADHFIQKDNPDVVAQEIVQLVELAAATK